MVTGQWKTYSHNKTVKYAYNEQRNYVRLNWINDYSEAESEPEGQVGGKFSPEKTSNEDLKPNKFCSLNIHLNLFEQEKKKSSL